jgi:hypothetical protein
VAKGDWYTIQLLQRLLMTGMLHSLITDTTLQTASVYTGTGLLLSLVDVVHWTSSGILVIDPSTPAGVAPSVTVQLLHLRGSCTIDIAGKVMLDLKQVEVGSLLFECRPSSTCSRIFILYKIRVDM